MGNLKHIPAPLFFDDTVPGIHELLPAVLDLGFGFSMAGKMQ